MSRCHIICSTPNQTVQEWQFTFLLSSARPLCYHRAKT
uniref:Uncharacterized protein n=1 Tax=Rhizophora mucronata TaxID=61149 RepID=A0A2P2PTT5_RHIMU